MKKIFLFAFAALALGFTACVEDDPYMGFSSVTQSPTSVTPDDNVTVTATTLNMTEAPSLIYKVNGGAETTVAMTGSNNTYTGVIPAQADGAKVTYWLVAGSVKSEVKEYTVSAVVIQVVINEVNGAGDDADKYVEFYNKGTAEVDLNGFTMTYNGNVTWTGGTTHKIAAGAFLVLQGTKGTGDMSTGLSSTSAITLILLAADGSEADRLEKTVATTEKLSMERIPDGTGDFYYTTLAGTKGAANSTDTSGGKVQ